MKSIRIPVATLSAGFLLISCAPGMVDGTTSIGSGYFLADTGGNGRTVEFHGDSVKPKTIIGPRVGAYSKQGPIIVVARQPASVVNKDGRLDWQVSASCEYWIIDTATHVARTTTEEREYEAVRCGK